MQISLGLSFTSMMRGTGGGGAPVVITGTGPSLAEMTDGDTLGSAVTWGTYSSTAGSINNPPTREMSQNGGAWAGFDAGTIVVEDDSWRVREIVTDNVASPPQTFTSEAVLVSAAPAITPPVISISAFDDPTDTGTLQTDTPNEGVFEWAVVERDATAPTPLTTGGWSGTVLETGSVAVADDGDDVVFVTTVAAGTGDKDLYVVQRIGAVLSNVEMQQFDIPVVTTYRSIVGSGSPGSNTFNITDAQTWYAQIGGTNGIVNDANPKSLAEVNARRRWRAGILSDGVTLVTQQTRLQPSAWRSRINGVYGNILILNPGGAITTGSSVVFRDATHSDAVADGDLVNTAFDISAEGAAGFAVNVHVGFSFETTSQSEMWLSFFNITGVNYSTSALRYVGYTGYGNQVTVSVGASSPIACTMDRLQIAVSTAGSATKIFSSNVNGAVGNMVCVMDAVALVEDATHTDAVAEGDLIQAQLSGGGTAAAYIGGGVRMRAAVANETAVLSHGTNPLGGNGISPGNFWSGFNHLRRNNIDGESRNAIPRAGVSSLLAVNVAANVNAGDITLSIRRSGTNLNGVVTIPAGTAGVFTDATHTDAFVADENINTTSPQSQATGTTFAAISYKYAVA